MRRTIISIYAERVRRAVCVHRCGSPAPGEDRQKFCAADSKARLNCRLRFALTRNELSSALEASFGQVDVTLDAAKDFVIDRFFVA
jgi:hypothetical protein